MLRFQREPRWSPEAHVLLYCQGDGEALESASSGPRRGSVKVGLICSMSHLNQLVWAHFPALQQLADTLYEYSEFKQWLPCH